MHLTTAPAVVLDTSTGEFEVQDYRLRRGGREWTVLHTETVLTHQDKSRAIGEKEAPLPNGVALWPSAIVLAHEIAARSAEISGRRVLELGSRTSPSNIVARRAGRAGRPG
jgi:methyltransferase-like protein 23